MKKFLTLGFAAVAAVALATGCQKKEAAAPEAAPAAEAPAVVEETGTAATTTTGDHDDHHRRPPRPRPPRDPDARPVTHLPFETYEAPARGPLAFARGSGPGAPVSGGLNSLRSVAGLGGSPSPPRGGRRRPARLLAGPPRASPGRPAPGPRARVALPRRVSGAPPDPPARLPRGLRDPSALGLQPLPRRPVAADPRGLDALARRGRRRAAAARTRRRSTVALGERIDAQALLQFAATETDRSFAPARAAARAPSPRSSLHLPLYSGDILVAYLTLASPQPIDETRKGEIRALLAPLTASLHASRNWEIAVTDELSGLFSRRYFETRLSEEWARHRRYGAPLTVALFDLDHFKTAQRHVGHGAGDMAIRRFGEILQRHRPRERSGLPVRRRGVRRALPRDSRALGAGASPIASAARSSASRSSKDGRPFRVTVSAGVADTDGLVLRRPGGAARPRRQGALLRQGRRAATARGSSPIARCRARLPPRATRHDPRRRRRRRRSSGRRQAQPTGPERAGSRASPPSMRAQRASSGFTPSSPRIRPRSCASRRRGSRSLVLMRCQPRRSEKLSPPARPSESAAARLRPASPRAVSASGRGPGQAQRDAQRLGPRRDDEAGLAVPHELERTPGVLRREHGLAREKRFERHVPEVLARGRHGDQAGVRVQREQRLVVDRTRGTGLARPRPAPPRGAAGAPPRARGPRRPPAPPARAAGPRGEAPGASTGRAARPRGRCRRASRCGTGRRAEADGRGARSGSR